MFLKCLNHKDLVVMSDNFTLDGYLFTSKREVHDTYKTKSKISIKDSV